MQIFKSSFRLSLILLFLISVSACDFTNNNRSNSLEVIPNPSFDDNEGNLDGKMGDSKGFVYKNLFSKKVNDTDERFDRVETAVQDIYDILNKHLPAIENLTAIESDIENLVSQLQTLLEDTPDTPQSPLIISSNNISDTAAQPMQISPQTPSPTISTAQGGGINNIRVSESASKTRVVFDSKQKLTYKANFDPNEGILIVTSNAPSSAANLNSAANKAKVITSITQNKNNSSLEFILATQNINSVSKGTLLPPGANNPNYRYYIDLFK